MKYEDFLWRGVLASSMGVIVTEQVAYIRPAERVDKVTVPGRPGTLTLAATPSWEPVIYAPVCALRPDADREAVFAWLRGSGEVVFGSMPDYGFDGRLVNQIDFRTVFQAAGGYKEFTPAFECQPFRHLAEAEADVTVTSGMLLHNPGTVAARPKIVIRGYPELTLTVAGQAVELHSLGGSGGIVIDSEAQDCFNLTGSQLLNSCMEGDFPTLPPGQDFYISWSVPEGSVVTQVVMSPRWRWL